jgi:DNA polymerase
VLRYYKPHMTTNRFGNQSIAYQAYDAGKWAETETFGGKLVENIVQGIARDCLRDAMLSVQYEYPNIVMHIHDEMVVEVPTETAEEDLQRICALMAQPISWAPGLLLRGDGYLTDYYKKD